MVPTFEDNPGVVTAYSCSRGSGLSKISTKILSSFETFGHQIKHVLMCPQILCCLMWLFRFSYLACPETPEVPSRPKGLFTRPP